jgi:hypothetical protein
MDTVTGTGKLENNSISLSIDDDTVRQKLMEGHVHVFQNIILPDFCQKVKKAAIEWAQNNEAYDPSSDQAAPGKTDNWHRYDNNPEKSQTPHIFHAHNFDNIGSLNEETKDTLTTLFGPMVDLQNRLAGTTGQLNEFSEEYMLHPQIIHYPSGGGYFGRHIHPFEPQRFGLIIDLSEKGKDFDHGATQYFKDGDTDDKLDVEQYQNVGSLTIFRYDIPHAVSVVDEDKELKFDDPSGRWVAILPYY